MLKHESSVGMTYEGCSKAVSRVLNKLGRVESDVELLNKKTLGKNTTASFLPGLQVGSAWIPGTKMDQMGQDTDPLLPFRQA